MARRTTKAKIAKSPAPVAQRLGLPRPGPYHVLVLGERDCAESHRVFLAAGSAAHVTKLVEQTRYRGLDLETIARGDIRRQELQWIQRSARAAKLDGPWCRISEEISLVLDAYAYRDSMCDDDEGQKGESEQRARMEEARQRILRLAASQK